MFNQYRARQFRAYNSTRGKWIKNPHPLIALERFVTDRVVDLLQQASAEIIRDYNEASYLNPFWQNYPPDERGRQPVGDQFPWIEVGEHSIGRKLARLLARDFEIRDTGIPTGPDERFLLTSPDVGRCLENVTQSAWVFIDIKSVGPRDEAPHAVMSHNQISGDGIWTKPEKGMKNTILNATGSRAQHEFHCSVSPLYVLSDGTVAPVVHLVVKPIYKMLSLTNPMSTGQPLRAIAVVCIPNGLLLACNPGYLKQYPNLFFPGKDDKTKNPLKIRARVSFEILRTIADWRVRFLEFEVPNNLA
jgi:hypothetical protein